MNGLFDDDWKAQIYFCSIYTKHWRLRSIEVSISYCSELILDVEFGGNVSDSTPDDVENAIVGLKLTRLWISHKVTLLHMY